MVDYSKLEEMLKSRNIKKSELGKALSISSRTIAKIGKGEPISHIVIEKICRHLDCSEDVIISIIPDNMLLHRLEEEKAGGISGGIYHEIQVRMAYNSNHMEGSRLTEEQTRLIFETNTIGAAEGVLVDDILETVHHFQAIDYCIDHAKEQLTEDFIKELHYILKHDTQDSKLDWFAVGDYKKVGNLAGGADTAEPYEVEEKMKKLLADYRLLKKATLEDIVSFHVSFEKIHPFQDGNGRVGRLIAFKECLKNNIVPFVIEDHKKGFYYRGISEWTREKGYLMDTCRDGQDQISLLLKKLGIPFSGNSD